MLARMYETTTETIFEEGLHEFLTRFEREVAHLGACVHEVYLSGDV